jgi:hypothetical protein
MPIYKKKAAFHLEAAFYLPNAVDTLLGEAVRSSLKQVNLIFFDRTGFYSKEGVQWTKADQAG